MDGHGGEGRRRETREGRTKQRKGGRGIGQMGGREEGERTSLRGQWTEDWVERGEGEGEEDRTRG